MRENKNSPESPAWVEDSITKFVEDAPGMLEKTAKMSYTKPKVRERIKNRIMAGSRGGKPGQWSARKAQVMAKRYKAAGGGYRD